MIKTRSIKTHMILYFSILLIVVCSGLGIISYNVAEDSLSNTVKLTLAETAKQAALTIETSLKGELELIEQLADNSIIEDETVPLEEKLKKLSREAERNGYLRMGIGDLDGNFKFTDGFEINLKEVINFKKAISGINDISDPLISEFDNAQVVVFTVPIEKDGKVIGVLLADTNGNNLSTITNNIKIGETSSAFMLNKEGTCIADKVEEFVIKQNNNIKTYESEPSLKNDVEFKALVDIERKMIAGEKGTEEYTFMGTSKYLAYVPIESTGWSLGVSVGKDEILSELNTLNLVSIISSVVAIILGIIVTLLITRTIIEPIKVVIKHLNTIANGDLTHKIPNKYIKKDNEIGAMSKAVSQMQDSITSIIYNIKGTSSDIEVQSKNLSSASQSMTVGSENVSSSIEMAANGASQQAEELMNITEILNEFSCQLSEIVSAIENILSNNTDIKIMADKSNKDMEYVINSVDQVNIAFNNLLMKIKNVGENISKINEITDLINNIAEQTNLLALNAAIEAARAGEAGKGFSVVAEEIRKLAEQSKDSSNNIADIVRNISEDTKEMITTTEIVNNDLKNQKENIDIAINSFDKITKAVDEITPKIQDTNASATELEDKNNIILEKVEETAAIAEEISASSIEIINSTEEMNSSTESVNDSSQLLSSMTKEMLEQVNQFKIQS